MSLLGKNRALLSIDTSMSLNVSLSSNLNRLIRSELFAFMIKKLTCSGGYDGC